MNFIWPQALFLFALIPVFILLNIYFEKKRKKDLIPFGNIEVLQEAISNVKKIDFLKHLPITLKIILIGILIFAVSRPTSVIYVPMRDTKVMLLFDISISMEATDIQPNRLFVAKEAATRFIQDLPGGIQIGLGLFSGQVRIVVNPTLEKSKAINVLNRLDLNSLEPGTAIGDAILAGIDGLTVDDFSTIKTKENNLIVLVTDGEANIGTDPILAATQARINNINIQAIGIGNPFGTIIRGGILTRLDEYTLKEITSLSGGQYFNAQNMQDMNRVYKKIKKTIKLIPQETEITFIPLIIALITLVIIQLLKWSKFKFA